MSGTLAPIDLAPHRPGRDRPALRRVRGVAGHVHVALAAVVIVAVFAQVYLIGAYLFGAGEGALNAHRSVGFTAHGIEVLVLVAALVAWLPRTDVLLSLALAVVGTAQIALASGHRWVGALHPLGALVVLSIAAAIVARRRAAGRRSGAPAVPPTSSGVGSQHQGSHMNQ